MKTFLNCSCLFLDELPSNLVILDLRGNPCTEVTGYRRVQTKHQSCIDDQ